MLKGTKRTINGHIVSIKNWSTILGLNLKSVLRETPKPLSVSTEPNEIWSIDFMHDNLESERSFNLI